MPQSPDIEKNSNGGVFDIRISDQCLKKVNCHNSRTCDDIDMKLGPVSKLEKKNKTTSREFDDDVMSANCEDIFIFSIYCQFGALQNLISRHIVCCNLHFH